MDSLADDFKTALTLKVPTTSISAHFSSDSDNKSDSSSVGDHFGSQGGSEGRKHSVPKISIGYLDSDKTAESQSSRSSNKISLGMYQSVKSSSSQTDLLSKSNVSKIPPQIQIIEQDSVEETKKAPVIQQEIEDEYLLSLPTISLAEVSKHNTLKDCWTSVDGLVYDITKFVPQHPGGKVIMQGAGKEATEVFHKRHGNLELKNTPVTKCCIGRLCETMEEQTYVKPEPNQLYAKKQYLDIF